MLKRPEGEAPIVFFDGVCGLCNRLVDGLLRADRRGALRFAPLQGETARRMLGVGHGTERGTVRRTGRETGFGTGHGTGLGTGADDGLDTLVFADGRGTALRSEAVLRALGALGGLWRVSGLLRLLPRPLRDAVYDAVAARRYRWFGRRAACRIPAPSERDRFLP
jgi:predicted DCC family thiol-disulfide oxidoreductase YuxK